jgi:phosphohistidine phosphatase
MKTLLILRHAKSSWDESDLPDHDRPLNKRGKNDAPRVGELLHTEGLTPDLIISSTARRARHTAELAGEACNYQGDLLLLHELYAAPPQAYLEALIKVDDEFERVMVVGHNPGVEDLLQLLTGESQPMPTAALARVDLPIEHWADLEKRTRGELVEIWRAKER